MTRTEFLNEHGPEFSKLSRKQMFKDFLEMLNEESPAKKPPNVEGDKLHGAPVFLNQIYGWEMLHTFIKGLAEKPVVEKEIPDTYNTPEV